MNHLDVRLQTEIQDPASKKVFTENDDMTKNVFSGRTLGLMTHTRTSRFSLLSFTTQDCKMKSSCSLFIQRRSEQIHHSNTKGGGTETNRERTDTTLYFIWIIFWIKTELLCLRMCFYEDVVRYTFFWHLNELILFFCVWQSEVLGAAPLPSDILNLCHISKQVRTQRLYSLLRTRLRHKILLFSI